MIIWKNVYNFTEYITSLFGASYINLTETIHSAASARTDQQHSQNVNKPTLWQFAEHKNGAYVFTAVVRHTHTYRMIVWNLGVF